MISGAKNHQNNLDDIERTEREALEAMKNKEFPQVHPENISGLRIRIDLMIRIRIQHFKWKKIEEKKYSWNFFCIFF